MTRHAGPRLCAVAGCRRDDTPRLILDNAWICPPCGRRMASYITDLPTAWAALGHALTPTSTGGQRVAGTPGHPLPIRPEVADTRHEIRAWLTAEVLMWHADLAVYGWPADTVTATAAWLAVWADRARHREWAPCTHDAARALRGRARALVDVPRDKASFPVLACPDVTCRHDTTTRGVLPGHVWARVPTDLDTAVSLACNTCGRTWAWSEWTSLARAAKAADLRRREPVK